MSHVVAAAAAVVFAVACPAAETAELAEAMPADALIFLDVPSVPALRAGGAGSAYARIMSEEAVRKFIEEGFPALTSLREEVKVRTGKSIGELLEMCTGEAAFALVPHEQTVVAGIIAVEVGPDTTEFKEFVAGIEGGLPGEWDEVEIPGAVAKVLVSGPPRVSYALVGDTFLVCSSPDTLKEVAAGILSGKSDNLAGSAKLTTALAAAGVEQPELLVYADVSSLLDLLLKKAPEELAVAFERLGIRNINSVVYWSRPAGEGFLDTLFVHFPRGRTGVFAAVEDGEGDYKRVLSMVPPTALSASWGYGDLGVLCDSITATLKAALPQEILKALEAGVATAELELGFRLREDLVASLGKNSLGYTLMPSQVLGMGFSGGFGQGVTMLELADQERFEKALSSAWAYAKGRWDGAEFEIDGPPPLSAPIRISFREHEFAEKTVYEVTIALNPMLQVAPAMVVSDGWLIVAMDPQSIKSVLSAAGKQTENLFDNTDYIGAAAFAGRANASASYSNSKAMFENLYPMVSSIMPFVLGPLGAEAPLDQWLLPPGEVISKHLFGTATAGTVSDTSFKLTQYGPVGLVRCVHLLAATGGPLVYWQARRSTHVDGPWGGPPDGPNLEKNNLKMIGLALMMYSNDHSGAFPGDLESLESMGYLHEVRTGDFRYVAGLRDDDDPRLIVAFARKSAPEGRLALFVDGHVMSLSDGEAAEQAGAWLELTENPTREQLEAACEKNLRVLAASVKKYAEFHQGKVPAKLDKSVHYWFAPLVVNCPADESPEGTDYATVAGLNVTSVGDELKGKTLIVYEVAPLHAGGHGAIFLDGTFKRLTREELDEAVQSTRLMTASDAPAAVTP